MGYAGKKVKGRKIHALVDTERTADAGPFSIRRRFPWLKLIWADGGYNTGQLEAAVAKMPVPQMEIVKRSNDMSGFIVLPPRWLVERTFSWFGRNRRLA